MLGNLRIRPYSPITLIGSDNRAVQAISRKGRLPKSRNPQRPYAGRVLVQQEREDMVQPRGDTEGKERS